MGMDALLDAGVLGLRGAVGALCAEKQENDVSAEQTTSGAVGFTPGPWAREGTDVMATVNGRNEMISCAYGFENARGAIVTTRESRANARLIAAAPDLYEALSDLVEIIERAGVSNLANGVQLGQMSWAVKAGDRMRWAKTCLAKATGTLLNTTDSAASSPAADHQAPEGAA